MISNIRHLKESSFVRRVFTLLTGTALAQAIGIAISPVLTRIFSPAEFGMFAVFLAFVSTFVPGITGRYEIALLLPKLKSQASEIFSIAVWFGIFAFVFFLILVITFENNILQWLEAPKLQGWILIAPFVVLLQGYFNLMMYYANRSSKFDLMARATILQAVVVAVTSVLFGLYGAGFWGLLLGNILGMVMGFLYLLHTEKEMVASLKFKFNAKKVALAKRYKGFPLYNATMSIVNNATTALPIFFLTNNFSPEIIGFYALVVRVLNAPLSFISVSVSQVNMKKVVELVHSDNNITLYLFKMAGGLLFFSIIPALVIGFFGQPLFAFVFGEEWRFAGNLAQIMAIAIAIRFVASTLSPTLGVINKNHIGALWKVIAFISTLSVLTVSTQSGSIEDVVIAIVINDFALYTLYFMFIVLAVRDIKKKR